jgi:hypothetical protein
MNGKKRKGMRDPKKKFKEKDKGQEKKGQYTNVLH